MFGGPGQGAGQFEEGVSVAVDNSGQPLTDSSAGDVYVADRNNNRIDKFTADGEFLLAWGEGVADGNEEPETCGPDAKPAPVECHAGLPGGAAGELNFPDGVAVDSSTLDASTGDVYVEDLGNHRIDKFTADGEFRLAWGEGVADGKEEAEACGPEAVISTCRAAVEPPEGTGEGPGEFERLPQNTVAVDSVGTVYVGGVSRVQEFSDTGAFKLTMTIASVEEFIEGLAVDEAKHVYVMQGGVGGVHEYESCATSCTGVEVGPVREPGASGFTNGIAVGPSNELFVASEGERRVSEWNSAGTEVADFPSPDVGGIAAAFADEVGRLLVSNRNEIEVLAPLPGVPQPPLVESEEGIAQPAASATVRASIDAEGSSTKYHVVYGPEGGGVSETEPLAMTAEAFAPETVEVKLLGLKPGVAYHFHFVAENTVGPSVGADERFAALPPVGIDGESVSQVSASSARLEAELNPLGSETHYAFSYGPTSACGGTECTVPAGEGDAGSGTTDVPVNVLVEGLSAEVTYHYRLIARNPLAPPEGVEGAEHTFTTQAAGGSTSQVGLIDGRAWEMVSPPNKHGATLDLGSNEAGVIQASEDGSRISYFAYSPVSSTPAGTRSFAYSQLLSTRGEPGVWNTQDITTRGETVEGLEPVTLSEYKLFSGTLSAGLVEPQGATPLTRPGAPVAASERTPYVWDEASDEYVPLLPAVGMRPGAKFGGHVSTSEGTLFTEGVKVLTATPDLSHVILTSQVPLTEDFAAGFEDGGEEQKQYEKNLYEWHDGAIKLINFLPDSHPATEDGKLSAVGTANANMRNAVSTDGSRVVFESESLGGTERHLFVRDLELGQTVQLDVPQEGIVGSGGGDHPEYVDASEDGSRVFFKDTERLTPDSTAQEGAPDLYVCELSVVGGVLSCALKNLSGDVQGTDLGIDGTGTYVYYVAGGAPALYVSNAGTGERRLIANLDPGDSPDWKAGEEHFDLGELTSRVSSDGRFVAFMSDRNLTGYDNVDANSGQPDEEVFLYDRVADTLRCVSCNPTGSRPVGVFDPATDRVLPLLVDRPSLWSGRWLAGSLPGWPRVDDVHALYQPRNLDNNGRLFFNSADALVPGDANGKEDVYEFEPDGVGSCRLPAGCIGLISSGTSSEESAFLDASAVGPGGGEGEDVFFMTSAKLASQDVDGALDVYDAHVCSGAQTCASGETVVPPGCNTADSCRAAPMAQPDTFGPPASATFSGPGTTVQAVHKTAAQLRAEKLARALGNCRKKRKKSKRLACERKARHAFGTAAKTHRARSASKASRTGRAGKANDSWRGK